MDGTTGAMYAVWDIVGVLRHTQYLKAALHSVNVSFGTNEV